MTENPSWRAVAPLHNTVIHTDSALIHVTAIGPVKVTYSTVLALLPGLHARPPKLPSPDSEDVPMPRPVIVPPPEGYDFIFHLGAGRNGALSIEQVGHKSGYGNPGVDGKMAPVIATSTKPREFSAADHFETERIRQNAGGQPSENVGADPDPDSLRGFAEGYECFPEELRTEVDVPGLIEHLKQQGETVSTPSQMVSKGQPHMGPLASHSL